MGTYLITGRGGSGKSTIALKLQRQGYAAFDADDVPGLARSEDLRTGQPIDVDFSGYVDYSKVAWNWQAPVMRDFLADHEHEDVFLCGSASNQQSFYGLFTRVFILMLDPETHKERLSHRASAYGKEPRMMEELVSEHQRLVQVAMAAGATGIDAGQPLPKIVEDIVGHVHHD